MAMYAYQISYIYCSDYLLYFPFFSSVFFLLFLCRVNVESAVNILSSTSTSFGASSASNIDEKLQRQLLAEEEQAMQKYKVYHRNIDWSGRD